MKLRIGGSVLGGHPRSLPQRALRFGRPWHELADRALFLDHAFKALSYNGIRGDYAEFGCAGGNTFAFAYDACRRHRHDGHLWAFDSFEGLPATGAGDDHHPRWIEGVMSTSEERFHTLCRKRGIPRRSYSTVPGYYSVSLSRDAARKLPSDIALAYVDCDMYSSTVDVLGFLEPLLKSGMIIAFDDWFCWTGDGCSGEQRAFESWISRLQWRFEPFLQFGWSGKSFVVFPE